LLQQVLLRSVQQLGEEPLAQLLLVEFAQFQLVLPLSVKLVWLLLDQYKLGMGRV